MWIAASTRNLRDVLQDIGVDFETDDWEEEQAHFETTRWSHRGHEYVALYAFAVTDDNEKVGVSLGWKFGYVELTIDGGEPTMTDEYEVREMLCQ